MSLLWLLVTLVSCQPYNRGRNPHQNPTDYGSYSKGEKGDTGLPGPPGPPGICSCPSGPSDHTKSVYINKQTSAEKSQYGNKNALENINSVQDRASLNQALNKENYKIDSGYKGFNKQENSEVLFVNTSDVTNVDFQRNYTIGLKSKYNEAYGDEGHKGRYKGNEYEVKNEMKNEEGGYMDREIESGFNDNKYYTGEMEGNKALNGKYFGDEYVKYGDTSQDERQRDVDVFGYYKYEKSKDTGYKGYGAGLTEEDGIKDEYYRADSLGRKQEGKEMVGYNKGKYANIQNKGSNKAAEYEGDYNTRNKYHDLDTNANFYEKLNQSDSFTGGINGLNFNEGDIGPDTQFAETYEYKSNNYAGNHEAYNNVDAYKEKEYVSKDKGEQYKRKSDLVDEYDQVSKEGNGRFMYGYKKRMVDVWDDNELIGKLEHKIRLLNFGFIALCFMFGLQSIFIFWFK